MPDIEKYLDFSIDKKKDIVYNGIASDKRVCWNRQTGTFEGRVFHDVWVQVPSLAPKRKS